jgi:para-aminobenzoate synthetase component 1
MIKSITKAEAQKRMNEYGEAGIPFLFLIDFEMEQPVVLRLDEVSPDELLYDINGQSNFRKSANFQATSPGYLRKYPIRFEDYTRGFELVQQALHAGNSYLVNLTYPTLIQTPLSLKDIFHLSRARYRIWWKEHFTVFSPEIFVTIDAAGTIASFPMKGTIDAELPDAERRLLEDEKERSEHATIVDLIRNDLGMVAKKVEVKRYRYVERIQTGKGSLLQSSSEIVGTLGADFASRIGELVFRLLPAGSISGAPKQSTVDIIQRAEGQARNYYTGICGLFDGQRLDSGVMIRFVESTPKGLQFRSGGGITSRSQPKDEYQELIQKVYFPLVQQPVLLV